MERVSIEADQLDADTIKKIEEAVATLPANLPDPYRPKRVNGVPRHALLHPTHAEGRLQGQAFALGDRVVYVQNSGKVDIAKRGTVVGINTATLDVVFDLPIMSGSTLGGRCSENRGSIVSKSSVLNLTNPTVVALSKAALQRKPDNLPNEANSRTASPAVHVTRSQFNRRTVNPDGEEGESGIHPGELMPLKLTCLSNLAMPPNKAHLLIQPSCCEHSQSECACIYNAALNAIRISIAMVSRFPLLPIWISDKECAPALRRLSRDQPPQSPPVINLNNLFRVVGAQAVLRSGRGGRGGPIRGGAVNGSPENSGRGGRGRGRGRGVQGTAPPRLNFGFRIACYY